MALGTGPAQYGGIAGGIGADDPAAGANPVIFAGGIQGDASMPRAAPIDWPLDYNNLVAAPAGEVPRRPMFPSTAQLDRAHKALQVLFMGLALIGLVLLVGSAGPRAVVRGAARKHAVQGA